MLLDVLLLEGQLTWNTPLLVSFTCIAFLYLYTVRRFTAMSLLHKQPLFFISGLTLLYLTIGSPISAISHLSFSSHMIQMSIVYFIVPPVLLLGVPDRLFQQIRKIRVVKNSRKFTLSPTVALYTFGVLFLMYHLPAVLNLLSQHPLLYQTYIVLLFVLSFRMWWPIAAPDTKRRFCKGEKKRYALLSGVVLMPACLLFIVSGLTGGMNNPFLTQLTAQLCISPGTSTMDFLSFPFNTKYDQLMGGILMLGLHKFGLMLTFRIGNNVHRHHWEKICQCGSAPLLFKRR